MTRNIPGPGSKREAFEEQLHGCDCRQGCLQESCPCLQRFHANYHPQTQELLPDAVVTSSLKPILECNSWCACDAACSSRLVQHGPRVRLKVAPSGGGRGFGLFACEDVKKLTFVCEYAGEVVGVSEAGRRLGSGDGGMNYLIVLREHCATGVVLTCVDPRCMGNVGRFANHSCDPNLLMVPVRVDNSVPRLALFARRDITAGEELTFDYSGETVLDCLVSPGGVSHSINTGTDLHEAEDEKNIHSDSNNVGHDCDGSVDVESDVNLVYPEAVSSDGRCFSPGGSAIEKVNVQSDVKRLVKDDEGRDESIACRFDNRDAISHIHLNPTVATSLDRNKQTGHHWEPGTSISEMEIFKETLKTDELEERIQTKCSALQNHHGQNYEDGGKGNADQPAMPGNDSTGTLNMRKRKHFVGTDGGNCDGGGRRPNSDREPPPKGLVLSETGTGLAAPKACLCGSAHCRGYLPFDRLIFSPG